MFRYDVGNYDPDSVCWYIYVSMHTCMYYVGMCRYTTRPEHIRTYGQTCVLFV